ncbi:alcohol dehydrogenase catalytic domain-containing protein [Streptomyces somaliensis]|uniref:zinc-dependent alcohol dehydrogenase n=1 Tax=Streptomyces somaliensis TaxID=78355 RepID=UPI0020CC4A66|nr:alcohol dehydrogenase catalytic domain-containing protein [Streptomyces somaliensis]MCP9943830.1 alcohol dehydrogenase catalytic domain-containing protein [Streptomyces somaliensis]
MKALVLTEQRTLSLVDRPKPEAAAPTDVVVKVAQTGICGTDRSVLVGKFPAEPGVVMGHEAVGVVDAVGPAVTRHKPGDRVIINPTLYCGGCPTCLEGHWNFCRNKAGTEVGLDLDGAFAEYIRLPERFIHRMPDGMDFDRASVVEPLACALNNLEAGRLQAGETAVVVGGGPVGAVCALLAHHYGARVLLIEPDPYRRELCRRVLSHTGDGRVDVHAPDGTGLDRRGDVVVDTVGNLLEQSMEYAADRGRVVIMGYNSNASATVRPLYLLQRGLHIIGAGDYNSRLFPTAIELARWLPLEKLITHRFPLEEHGAAFAALAPEPGAPYSALKVVLAPEPAGATE